MPVPVRLSRPIEQLPPQFASDYIRVLRTLSRKHREDDAEHVSRALRLLRHMSQEAEKWRRGELWVPEPDPHTGYYPMIENVPYGVVRTMLRKNTSSEVREKARGIVAASSEPFVPLFARRPGTLNEAQRRSLLAHMLVSLPLAKGRYPAFLGKMVPGELEMMTVGDAQASEPGTGSKIPIRRMAPEDWERGFTMRKFSLSDDLTRAIKRRLVAKPRLMCPHPRAPKTTMQDMIKRATKVKVGLEPERNYTRNDERQCYEDGFRTRVQELKEDAKHKARRLWRWLLRSDLLPTALRGATIGVAQLVHTERGMGPTTIDKIPVQRIGLAKQFYPYPSKDLRGVAEHLRAALAGETDPITRGGLEKGLANIITELAVRRALI